MATTEQQNAAKKTRLESDPRRGIAMQPALLLLILGALELAVWIWCNIQQIISTHDAIFALLQSGTQLSRSLSPQQVLNLINGNMDHNNRVAYTIAFVTQIIFLLSAFPISFVHGHLAAKYSNSPYGHGIVAHINDIRQQITTRRVVFAVFFIGDMWTDLRYASLNNREWLAPALYVLAMWAGSTLVGLDGWQRLTGVWIALQTSLRQFQSQREEV